MESQKLSNASYTSQTFLNGQDGVYQHVTIGTVTEVCEGEARIILTPSVAREFIFNGHKVCIQSGAGNRAGFTDEMYFQAGVAVLPTAEAVYREANVILKVRQPQQQELQYIHPQQVIFCFMEHANKNLIQDLMGRQMILIGYQYLQNNTHSFPVFNAVAELHGYLGVQQAMQWFESQGKVFGQLGGVSGANVLILGAGACGRRAALLAAGAGAHVTVMDTCTEALRGIATPAISTLHYTTQNLEQILPTVDVLIGASLPVTGNAPVLVQSNQMKLLHQGAFAIDLAVEFGGNFECSTIRSLQDPITNLNGISLYSGSWITNLVPNAFATSVGNAVLPWALQVANKGWRRAVMESYGLQQGLCFVEDKMTNQLLSTTTELPYTPIEKVLEWDIQQLSHEQDKLYNLRQKLTSLRFQNGFFGCTIEA